VSKPAQTYQDQLAMLKRRGLTVADEVFALHCLEHHNYYRFSAYRFPFTLAGNSDQFQPGTTFQQIWDLYQFDRTLRHLVLEACQRVEISVRSRLAYEIGHRLGPLAYLANSHFHDPLIHARTLVKLHSEMERSKESFIKHYRDTLKMPWPPVWVVVEVASFGVVSNLLGQLQPPALRRAVADTYQLDEKTFCSFFHHLTVLRNIAAHHSRLWDRKLVITFQLPRKKPAHLWPNFCHTLASGPGREGKVYNSLILLVHLIQIIEPPSHWPQRLARHIQTLGPRLVLDMGFPADWKDRPVWKSLLAAEQPFQT
jgi:abortive infection bacteriophage resistance protein